MICEDDRVTNERISNKPQANASRLCTDLSQTYRWRSPTKPNAPFVVQPVMNTKETFHRNFMQFFSLTEIMVL